MRKYRTLSRYISLILLLPVSAAAEGHKDHHIVTDTAVQLCKPPPKGQEEFEPFLCPFQLPKVKSIEILQRIENTHDIYYNNIDCAAFLAVKKSDIIKYFRNANLVQQGEMHAKLLEMSPCHITGTFRFTNGKTAHWKLQGGIYLGHITMDQSGESLHLYCPKSCGFIPTYTPDDK